jgi:ABC-type cobalamin/Fe3+-siderophores transport system ATPase subunit
MPFNLNFPAQNPNVGQLQLEVGEMLFVLGANGTGKSSLMQRFAQQNRNDTRKIAAHRQTWMNSDALDMTPSSKLQTEENIKVEDSQIRSRYQDRYAAQRASMTIYDLIDAENVRARAIAAGYDADDQEAMVEAAKADAPIKVINELLLQSNIPVEITIRANERIMASKEGGPEYSAAQLSDGERNALLIAGSVLTAKPGALLIIDEPERHLHRSIISPLLSQLFERRQDCGFVISTHDHDIPLENPEAKTLLLRSCTFEGQDAQTWEADILEADAPIDDVLKRDLLGSRRKLLFVEGTEKSLDKPLYSLIFPIVSVVPKGNCRAVEQSVVGVRAGGDFHWLQAFGIADGDGFGDAEITAKAANGIYAVPYYSVEAIYFHPQIIKVITGRQAAVSGDDPAPIFSAAIDAGVNAVRGETERLSRNVAKKLIRELIMQQIPNDDDLLAGAPVEVEIDAKAIHTERKTQLDTAVKDGDWLTILTHAPVRECSALNDISAALKFRRVQDYQKAVRHLLTEDQEVLKFVRQLFGDLFDKLTS